MLFICLVPPDEPRIFDTHGKEVSTLAGPFREGQEFFLSCQVNGGNPPPKVSWWRSDVEIPGTTHQSIVTGAIINNILMRAVPRDYYATKLTCRAQGTPLIDPVIKEVTVQLHRELHYIKKKHYHFISISHKIRIHLQPAGFNRFPMYIHFSFSFFLFFSLSFYFLNSETTQS